MVRIAADAGYNSVGLWVAPGDNWHSNTAGEVAAALQETGLVALDVESFENSVKQMDEMSDKLRTFIEARAKKSFAELDEEMEDY